MPSIVFQSDGSGSLGFNIDGSSPTVCAISVTLISICLLVQWSILFVGSRDMWDKKGVNSKFKVLFVMIAVCISMSTIIYMAFSLFLVFNPFVGTILGIFGILPGLYSYALLLLILVLRLHVTFGQTEYKMSKCTSFVFIIIFIFLFALPVLFEVLIIVVVDFSDSNTSLEATDYPMWYLVTSDTAMCLYFFLFLIGSVLAVVFFVRKLNDLAKAQSMSPTAVPTTRTDGGFSYPSLNARQQKLSDLSARYVLLFAVAILSTLLDGIIASGFSVSSGVRGIFISADLTLNLFCVYLQFGFAGPHYRKSCGCLDRHCRKQVAERTMRSISNHSSSQESRHHAVPSDSGFVDSDPQSSVPFVQRNE